MLISGLHFCLDLILDVKQVSRDIHRSLEYYTEVESQAKHRQDQTGKVEESDQDDGRRKEEGLRR